jgi:type IV fimbrial biogenesis protein FimT
VFQLIEAKPVAGTVSGLVVEGVDGVTFNGFGQTSLLGGAPMPAPVRYDFRSTPASDCADSGGKMRCLRVMVSPGGQARMCDPAIVAVGDTRTC